MGDKTEKTGEKNVGNKVVDFLRKLYRLRVKVDRKDKTIINISSIFGAACLIFATKVTVIGVVAALLLGYQIHLESEEDDGELEEQLRKAAQNLKTGAVKAAKSIEKEISKAKKDSAPKTAEVTETAPKEILGDIVENTAEDTAEKDAEDIGKTAAEAEASNKELLLDLEAHMEAESNPAATTFHSAYAASAGSVPILQVDPGETPEPGAPAAKSRKN